MSHESLDFHEQADHVDEHRQAADELAAQVIERAQAGALAISSEVRRKVLTALWKLFREPGAGGGAMVGPVLLATRAILRQYEPYLARVASDGDLAAWLTGGRNVLQALSLPGKPPRPPEWARRAKSPGDPDPFVRFPIIREAAADLAGRELMTRAEFDLASRAARLTGFTTARVATLDGLAKIRDALAEAVIDGGTLKEFREKIDEALGSSSLSPRHAETVFRTNLMASYARGQRAVWENPFVRTGLPFVRTTPIYDSRLTELCRTVAESGLENEAGERTEFFAADDPVYIEYAAPRHWNCRCGTIYYTVARAARAGIKAAKEWLRTGVRPPDDMMFVPRPPVELPPGWTGSISLSAGYDESKHRRESEAHDGKRPGEFAPKDSNQSAGEPKKSTEGKPVTKTTRKQKEEMLAALEEPGEQVQGRLAAGAVVGIPNGRCQRGLHAAHSTPARRVLTPPSAPG